MCSISGVAGGAQSQIVQAAVAKKAPAASMVRDSDGDYDGTAVGKSDAKDFGKGVNLDRTA